MGDDSGNIRARGEPHWKENADLILQLGKDGVIELYMSTISIPSIAYVLKPISSADKKRVIKGLTAWVTLLPSLPAHVQPILEGPMNDLEDALQVQSAKEGPCELILTRNTSDFNDSDIPVLSPDEFLQRVLE